MTDLLHDVDAPSDAELISRVRGGDVAAYGELFSRHVDAAKRLSRQLVRGPDADDLVSEAFAKVLTVLQGGGGPDVAFRAYLLTSVRRLHVDRIRAGSRLQTSDDMEAFDPGVPFQDTAVAAFESGAAAKAFASLPERWQLVLWHLEVEGQKPADVAPLLGMSPNSVSALAYRAREGLRQAFLTMHLNDISETDCRWVNEHLGAYVRNGLAKRESTKVQSHLDECRRCTAMYLELTEVNSDLRGIIGPLLLGAAATGYLATSGTAAGGLGITAVFGRVRDTISANAGAVTIGAVAAGVAAVATAGVMLLPSSGPDKVVGADQPIGTVSTPGQPAGSGTSKPDGAKSDGPSASADVVEVSPAAILPSELPSPTEQPGVQVVQDTTDQSAGTDQGGTGTDQGGTGTGTGTTNPTEPTSTDPSPTEPSPTQPSPTQPSPTQPSPTQPSPTQPSPTQPSPTQPSPTQPTPTNPPPVTYKVVAGPATIENGTVSFDLTGDPQLPPTLSLNLQSEPAGVTFGSDGTCTVRAGDATIADCDTTPLTALAALPFARTMLAEAIQSFQITMPLTGAPQMDTLVTVILRDDQGVELAQTTGTYKAPVAKPDLSLAGFPKSVAPTNVHDYIVAGTLGVTGYTGDVVLSIADAAGRARFADGGVKGCTTSSSTKVVCPASTAGALALPLYVQDNRTEDTAVTITVGRADGQPDTEPTNDSVTVILQRYRPTPVDVAVTATASDHGNSGKSDVAVDVTASDSAVPVTLTATYDPDIAPAPAGCIATTGGATCSFTGSLSLAFSVELAKVKNEPLAGVLTFTASVPEQYEDTKSANDSSSVTVERFEGDAAGSGTLPTETQAPTTSAGDVLPAPSLVDGGAGSSTGDVLAVEQATKKVNQLLNLRQQDTTKADAAQEGKPAAKKADTEAPKQSQDNGNGKSSDVSPQGAAPAGPASTEPGNGNGQGPGNGNGNGNGNANGNDQGQANGQANGAGNGKKDEPNPVEQVVDALSSLLP